MHKTLLSSTVDATITITLTYLTVFTTPNLANHLVILLITPVDSQGFIIPIITRTMNVNIGVNSVDSDSTLVSSTVISC